MIDKIQKKYFTDDDGKFDPNDHVDKFALIYLVVVFSFCITIKAMGII